MWEALHGLFSPQNPNRLILFFLGMSKKKLRLGGKGLIVKVESGNSVDKSKIFQILDKEMIIKETLYVY